VIASNRGWDDRGVGGVGSAVLLWRLVDAVVENLDRERTSTVAWRWWWVLASVVFAVQPNEVRWSSVRAGVVAVLLPAAGGDCRAGAQ